MAAAEQGACKHHTERERDAQRQGNPIKPPAADAVRLLIARNLALLRERQSGRFEFKFELRSRLAEQKQKRQKYVCLSPFSQTLSSFLLLLRRRLPRHLLRSTGAQ